MLLTLFTVTSEALVQSILKHCAGSAASTEHIEPFRIRFVPLLQELLSVYVDKPDILVYSLFSYFCLLHVYLHHGDRDGCRMLRGHEPLLALEN
jgi:hypothetical protein